MFKGAYVVKYGSKTSKNLFLSTLNLIDDITFFEKIIFGPKKSFFEHFSIFFSKKKHFGPKSLKYTNYSTS